MTMRVKLLAIVGVVAVGVTAFASAPHGLRRIDSFKVRNVEIDGTRYLAPHEALKQSGITQASTVFDEFQPWIDNLEKHPLVADVSIERVVPSTILIHITETEPVAFVAIPELQAIDSRGLLLPVNPAVALLDLPVLAMRVSPTAGRVVESEAVAVLRVLAEIRRRDDTMFDWISEAMPMPGGGVRLVLRSPIGAEAYVSSDTRSLRLRELRLALSDLAARGEMNTLARVDARFNEQIVISLLRTAAG